MTTNDINTIRNLANDLIVARSVCPQQGDCDRCEQRAVEFAKHVPALLAELSRMMPVIEAAKVWRQWYGNTNAGYASACNDLAAAVDALAEAVTP